MKLLMALLPVLGYTLAGYVGPYTFNNVAYRPIINHSGAPIPSNNFVGAPAIYGPVAEPAQISRNNFAGSPTAYGPLAVPASLTLRSQFHAMDELGQGTYGHLEPFQSHAAVQDGAGNRVGSFSYISPEGQLLRTDYIADAGGFRVASNALPVGPTGPLPTPPEPVTDTPEVAAARAAHLREYEEVRSRSRRGVVAPAPPVVIGYRPATLTTVVGSPGHSVSYRVE